MRRLLVTGAALGLLALSTLQVPNSTANAAAPPLRGPLPCPTLPDVDIRTALISSSALLAPEAIEGAAMAKSDARRTQVVELEAAAPGVQIRWSALTSGPRLIVPVTGAVTEARTGTPADIGAAFIRANAALYQGLLRHERVFVPPCRNEEFNTFHTFVIRTLADRLHSSDKAISALER